MRPMILMVGLGCLFSACALVDANQHRPDEETRGAEMSTESDDVLPLREVKWLGVETQSVGDRSTARQLGLPRVIRGALVNRVMPRMPAARAGLNPGDVITEIRVGRGSDEIGYSIASSADLERVLVQLEDRGHFSVEVFRGPAPLNRSSYATQLFRVWLKPK